MTSQGRHDSWTYRFAEWWIRERWLSLALMVVPTLVLASQIPKIEVSSRFADLLPQRHEFIKTYNEMRETFGGANVVTMSLESSEGDIFNYEALEKVRFLTDEVDKVHGVNHYQVASVAHRKIRRIITTAGGLVKSTPVLPRVVPQDEEALKRLREEMFNNDIVYGTYLSEDGKAALILAGFDEERLDYPQVYKRLRTLRELVEAPHFFVGRALDRLRHTTGSDEEDGPETVNFAEAGRQLEELRSEIEKAGLDVDAALLDEVAAQLEAEAVEPAAEAVGALSAALEELNAAPTDGTAPKTRLYTAGEPMLKGWIYHHAKQLPIIFALTGAVFVILLGLNFRSVAGVALPLVSTGVSALWGLGFVGLVGYNLDPLILVVPILISARTASHAVQWLERYRDEVGAGVERRQAVINTMGELLTPGWIAIFTDAMGLLVLAVSSIPIIAKLGIFCCIWSGSNLMSVPLMLPWLVAFVLAPTPRGKAAASPGERELSWPQQVMFRLGNFLVSPRSNVPVGAIVLTLVVGSLWFAKDVEVGENRPGSPILFPDGDYNVAAAAINNRFAGSNQLSVYVVGKERHSVKRSDVVRTMERFRDHMMAVPGAGGTRDIPTLVRSINRLYHFDDPRWSSLPEQQANIGNILFMYEAGAAIPGVILEYMDYEAQTANFVVFFKDATGETVSRAIAAAKDFMAANPIEGMEYRLAGGYVGVTAAANEEIEESEILQTLLIMFVVMLSVLVTYRSVAAPLLVFVVLVVAVLVNRAFMGIRGIGLNVNTLPVTAVGIGIGVDYAIYILDRIREEARSLPVEQAIVKALSTTGAAVVFTAVTVVFGIFFWITSSDLRFNSEMALLLTLLMGGHMVGAVTILPMMIRIVKPRFITGADDDVERTIVA